jgi:hypothetical protein
MVYGFIILIVLFAVLYLVFFNSPVVSELDENGKMVPKSSSSSRKSVATKKVTLPPLVFPKQTLALVVTVVLAQQVLLYETVAGAGWALFIGVASVATFFLYQKKQRNWLVYSMVAAAIVGSLLATFRASGFVQVVNATFIGILFVLMVFFKTYQKIRWDGLWLLKYLLLLIPESIRHFFRVLSQTGSQGLKGKKAGSFSMMAVIKTVALTLVVLAVFVGLLSNADPVFAEIIRDIWDSAIGRVLTGLVATVAVLLIATFSLKTSEDEVFKLTFFSFWDVFVPMLSVGILFGLFLFVQSQYLFGGHQDLALFDLTYSEYVRKGFIELMWASLFGSLLTYFVYMKKELLSDEKQKQALKIVSVLFSVELVMLVGSAFKRNLLYIDTFGLTRVRIIGNFFLAWLAGAILLLLAMSLIKKMQEKHFLSGVWIVSIAVVLGLNVVNIDEIVFAASPNLEDVSDGKIKDYFYLANLSEDVASEWPNMVAEMEQQVASMEAKSALLTESELQRLANAKLATMSLQKTWERLDKKYGDAVTVKETYYPDVADLPENLQQERRLASLKVGELRGYEQMKQNQVVYTTTLPEILARIDRVLEVRPDQSLFEFENTLLYDYRRPFISTDLDYYPQRPVYKQRQVGSPSPSPSILPTATPVPSLLPAGE